MVFKKFPTNFPYFSLNNIKSHPIIKLFLHLAKQSFARCTRSGNVKKKKKSHTFWLSSEQYIYMKERSDTRMMETTNVKTSEPHQPALVLNCYVIWLRSKWGSKLTYFSNFAIYYLLVQLRVKSRLKQRVVKWVYFHSQPFSNRLNWLHVVWVLL